VQHLGEEFLTQHDDAGFSDIVPVSVAGNVQVDTVLNVLTTYLPESPPLYPDGDITDEPDDVMIAELIREAALEDVFDELPHSLAVIVSEMQQNDSAGTAGLTTIYAEIYVERDSQKGIIIGKGGAQLRSIGQRARRNITRLFGSRGYQDLEG